MVTMVDIVVVETDVVGVLVLARGEVDLFTVLDMIFKTSIIDHIVLRFSRITYSLVHVGRLFRESRSDHSLSLQRRVV
jgi:hypothetical protein